ncbi:hypothetical protein [Streptomyces sp. NPDC018610]|jgi:hypothetical protein|uniref:hypothetical protein n=1 Tax=Streptomyces sp. NPDC018610 TaxID=3365049 RepID=UPI0037983814
MASHASDTLRRGVEEHTASTLGSLHTDDAQVRVVDRDARPTRSEVPRGRDETMIQAWDA